MTEQLPSMEPPTQTRRWVFWALLVSAGVNLLLIGAVVGHLLHRQPFAERVTASWRGGPPSGGIERVLRSLDPEQRKQIQNLFSQKRKDLQPDFAALAEAREDARKAFAEEPFSPEAAAAALMKVREKNNAVQTEMHAGLIEAAMRMPPEARAKLGDLRWLGRGSGERGDRKERGDGSRARHQDRN